MFKENELRPILDPGTKLLPLALHSDMLYSWPPTLAIVYNQHILIIYVINLTLKDQQVVKGLRGSPPSSITWVLTPPGTLEQGTMIWLCSMCPVM